LNDEKTFLNKICKQKRIKGVGVEKDENIAMEYFQQAAEQGHPHASYNLAVGHLKGLKTGINRRLEFILLIFISEEEVFSIFLTRWKIYSKNLLDLKVLNQV
jgi:TPR repeat protein